MCDRVKHNSCKCFEAQLKTKRTPERHKTKDKTRAGEGDVTEDRQRTGGRAESVLEAKIWKANYKKK